MNNEQIEKEIQQKGLNAPRLSPQSLDDAIDDLAAIQYHNFPGTAVTVCCVPMKNGYHVVGEGAAVSLENFDAELGRKIALAKAKDRMWPLLGYALKEELAKQPGTLTKE